MVGTTIRMCFQTLHKRVKNFTCTKATYKVIGPDQKVIGQDLKVKKEG